MRRIASLVVLFLLLGSATALAEPGAFTLPESQILGHFGVRYFLTSQYLDRDGEIVDIEPQTKFREIGGIVQMQVGVTEDLELGVLLPGHYMYRTTDFDDETSYWLGDIEVDVAYCALGGSRAALTTAGKIVLPFFYDAEDELPPGYGKVYAEARLLGAVRFSLFTAGIDGGYRWWDGDPADMWRYGGELNFVYNIVYGGVRLDGYASAGNYNENAESTYFYHAPDYCLGKVNIKMGVMFTNHVGLELLAGHTAYGRNVAYGTDYQLTVVYRY